MSKQKLFCPSGVFLRREVPPPEPPSTKRNFTGIHTTYLGTVSRISSRRSCATSRCSTTDTDSTGNRGRGKSGTPDRRSRRTSCSASSCPPSRSPRASCHHYDRVFDFLRADTVSSARIKLLWHTKTRNMNSCENGRKRTFRLGETSARTFRDELNPRARAVRPRGGPPPSEGTCLLRASRLTGFRFVIIHISLQVSGENPQLLIAAAVIYSCKTRTKHGKVGKIREIGTKNRWPADTFIMSERTPPVSQ